MLANPGKRLEDVLPKAQAATSLRLNYYDLLTFADAFEDTDPGRAQEMRLAAGRISERYYALTGENLDDFSV